jgi:hypothetical protein
MDPQESLADRKKWLLSAIAELDTAFEAGKVDKPAYQRRRQELKAELIDTIQRLDD